MSTQPNVPNQGGMPPMLYPQWTMGRTDIVKGLDADGVRILRIKVCRTCQSSLKNCACGNPISGDQPLPIIWRAGQGENRRLKDYLNSNTKPVVVAATPAPVPEAQIPSLSPEQPGTPKKGAGVDITADPSSQVPAAPKLYFDPSYTKLPESVKKETRFLGFQCTWGTTKGKFDKRPFNPVTGVWQNKPEEGVSFADAVAGLSKKPNSVLGIYIERPYIGIDYDDCRDPQTCVISEKAMEIVRAIDSYAEVSPSGTGVRIITTGRKPGDSCRRGSVEIYSHKRGVTLTGMQISGTAATVNDRDVSSLYNRMMSGEFLTETQRTQSAAMKASSGGRIENDREGHITTGLEILMSGTVNVLKPFEMSDGLGSTIFYDSPSEAVQGLLTRLAIKHDCDKDKMREDFETSNLLEQLPHWRGSGKWARLGDGEIEHAVKFITDNATKTGAIPADSGVQQTLEAPWEDPRPMDWKLPSIMPFDERMIPASLRPLVMDTADRMAVQPDFPAVVAVVALAGVVGRRAFVYPKASDKTWKEALNLWGAIVERPGRLKSPTINIVSKPVSDVESDWTHEYKKQLAAYMDAKKVHKAWERRERKRKLPNPIDPEPEIGEPPVQRRVLLNNSTPEKLHEVLSVNPAGVFVLRDELSGWLAELDQEGREVQRELFLTSWNGDTEYRMDRIGRGSRFAIMCVSMAGSFQPALLQNYLEKKDRKDGLFQRFQLFVWPDPRNWKYVDREANSLAIAKAAGVYATLAKLPAEALKLHFNSDAQKIFEAWTDQLMAKVDSEEEEDKQSHLSKYRSLMPTLAALFQLADIAAAARPDELLLGGRLIDVEHTQQAIAFCAYLESHLERIYAAIRPAFIRIAFGILGLIKDGRLKSGFAVRDLQRSARGTRGHASEIQMACDELEALKWLRSRGTGSNETAQAGRPSTKYEIHPRARDVLNAMKPKNI